jgi:hypothetical protein
MRLFLREDWSLAEKDAVQIVELRHPTQCVLWENPAVAAGKFSGFLDEVESYEDSSHLTRSLYRCRECGQLYFHEWYEWVDWNDGNDTQYSTLVPVQTSGEIAALKETSTFTLMTYFPRLHLDSDKPEWIGK